MAGSATRGFGIVSELPTSPSHSCITGVAGDAVPAAAKTADAVIKCRSHADHSCGSTSQVAVDAGGFFTRVNKRRRHQFGVRHLGLFRKATVEKGQNSS